MKKINISKEKLKSLYLDKKLSSRQVAKLYNCSKNQILRLIKLYRLRVRSKKETSKMIKHPIKYKIPRSKLEYLYYKRKLSTQQIADKYETYSSCIYNKMKRFNIKTRTVREGISLAIPRRSSSIAKSIIKYPRRSFSKDLIEKSYLIGFRKGDLNIRKNKYGETIFIQCKSTKRDQIDLIKNLFDKYGHVWVSNQYKDGGFQISCDLDLSFSFLLDNKDSIKKWILNNKDYFVAFLAGYVDAEGHFGIDRRFGEFVISSYDKKIIKITHKKLLEFNIKGRNPRISVRKGYVDKRGIKCNNNMWQFKITRKRELYKFINLIERYIKHQKRYKDMLDVKTNILKRGFVQELENEKKEILHNYSNLLY